MCRSTSGRTHQRAPRHQPRPPTRAAVVLEFRDGALVRALRRGEWVLLDELNLAPSEVIQINRMHLFFGVIISPVGGCLGTSQL